MLISYFVDDVYDLVSSLYKCDEEVFKYVFQVIVSIIYIYIYMNDSYSGGNYVI